MNDHLRPVPESGDSPAEPPPATNRRAAQRARAKRALPTDRMKFDMQVTALRAIAIASDFGKRHVGSEDIAPRVGVIPATAGLNNQFFMESGLILRVKKGQYKPTDTVNKFTQEHSFDPVKAGAQLAETLRDTWYYREVEQQLAMGTTTTGKMVGVLALEAGATKAHEIQLATLLTWLVYAGLITLDNDKVQLTGKPPAPTAPQKADPEPEQPPRPTADPVPEGTTTKGHQEVPAAQAVLSFTFDFALTAEDLQRLSPEQIQAVFGAVGDVMAIKSAIQK